MRKVVIDQPGKHVITLTQPGEEVEISGVFSVAKKEQIEVEVIIHHQAPRTIARTTLKGVATDQGRLKFTGRIIIDPECGQSNSFLTERVLLLSDEASAETVPDLEILTDDVKCSHAASITHLDPIQLFYLRSRGLSPIDAEQILVAGFLGKD